MRGGRSGTPGLRRPPGVAWEKRRGPTRLCSPIGDRMLPCPWWARALAYRKLRRLAPLRRIATNRATSRLQPVSGGIHQEDCRGFFAFSVRPARKHPITLENKTCASRSHPILRSPPAGVLQTATSSAKHDLLPKRQAAGSSQLGSAKYSHLNHRNIVGSSCHAPPQIATAGQMRSGPIRQG